MKNVTFAVRFVMATTLHLDLSLRYKRSMTPHRPRTIATVLSFVALVVVFASSRPAFAAGTVTLGSRELTENDGKWKLNLTIDMGSPPDVPHVPFLFTFTPTALYERALTDKTGDKPVLNKIPLVNQQGTNLSMDVGFADPGTGKVFKLTKFDFVIRRDRGFEAGEYDFTVKRESDGVKIGSTIHITLKGDNPVVDRRAIVFSGDKKKDAKLGQTGDQASGDDDKKDKAVDKKDIGDTDKKDEGDAKEPGTDPAGNTPPAVPPKQGGCGCRLAGSDEGGGLGLLGVVMLAALIVLRRR